MQREGSMDVKGSSWHHSCQKGTYLFFKSMLLVGIFAFLYISLYTNIVHDHLKLRNPRRNASWCSKLNLQASHAQTFRAFLHSNQTWKSPVVKQGETHHHFFLWVVQHTLASLKTRLRHQITGFKLCSQPPLFHVWSICIRNYFCHGTCLNIH